MVHGEEEAQKAEASAKALFGGGDLRRGHETVVQRDRLRGLRAVRHHAVRDERLREREAP